MTEQASFNVEDGAEDDSEFRERSADFTPYPVIRQGMEWVRSRYGLEDGLHHVDQCAGAGSFSVVSKEVFGGTSDGYEIRASEREHLVRNCGRYGIGNVLDHDLGRRACLFATNPAFPILEELLRQALESAKLGAVVMYLGLSDWGQRGEELSALWHEFPPHAQARISGAISFRGKQINPKTITKKCPQGKPFGSDMRSYSWWVWIADGEGGCRSNGSWVCSTLPRLLGPDRKWKVRPGTETAS